MKLERIAIGITRVLWTLVVLGLAACGDSHTAEAPCVEPPDVRDVDVLFVIDDSGSMTEELASLAVQLPHLIRALATGDLDGDGGADFEPPASLHFGVVTSDMGTGGFPVPTCADPDFGRDGILRTEGNTAIPDCMPTYPRFVDFQPGDLPEDAAADLRCVAQLYPNGCGFEQQLDAMLKAITPSTSDVRFVMGTTGHGDRENAGFLRPDSVIVVVLLSDEEDCSARDPDIFNPDSAVYEGNLNLRCFEYPGAVHPTARYVDELLALRDDPRDVVYVPIVGVPPGLVAGGATFDEILDDRDMQEIVDPSDPNRMRPSCNIPGRGLAFPPRRMVTVARDLARRGAHASVQSICQEDFTPAVDALLAEVAAAIDEPRCR